MFDQTKKKSPGKNYLASSAKPLQRDSENLWGKNFRSNPKEKRRNLFLFLPLSLF
jgi:hypothetical protein